MRVAVILNQVSGPGHPVSPEQLAILFREAGVEADLAAFTVVGALELTHNARRLAQSGVDAVIAAGGDGTVSAVAAALVGTDIPLGVLAMGTLNHFARDIGVPADLSAAIRLIATGKPTSIDVGEVNGRVFVNNSSIGIYPRVVKHRNRLRVRLVPSRWLAMFYAFLSFFRRFPLLDVALCVGDNTVHRSTPFVFIGNNRYQLHLTAMGERQSLTGGQLNIYVAHRPGRAGLLLLAIMALFRRLKQARDFDELCLTELTITTRKQRLAVAIDGEVEYMTPPLRYRTRAGELRVIGSFAARNT